MVTSILEDADLSDEWRKPTLSTKFPPVKRTVRADLPTPPAPTTTILYSVIVSYCYHSFRKCVSSFSMSSLSFFDFLFSINILPNNEYWMELILGKTIRLTKRNNLLTVIHVALSAHFSNNPVVLSYLTPSLSTRFLIQMVGMNSTISMLRNVLVIPRIKR